MENGTRAARESGGFWQRWLERHVPLMPGELSTLDLLDGRTVDAVTG